MLLKDGKNERREVDVRLEIDASLGGIEVTVRAPEEDEQVTALLEHIERGLPKTMLAYDVNGNLHRLDADDVVLLSVSGKQTRIDTETGRYTVRQPLQTLETMPELRHFVRISRYEIVNLQKVRKFDFTMSGTLRLELAGGAVTWASRRNIPSIRRKLTGKE